MPVEHAPVPLVLVLPGAAPMAGALRRRAARWFVPIYATVPEARTALDAHTALTECVTAHLEPDPAALNVVADLVRNACAAGQLSTMQETATTVLSKLVIDAIGHAGTPLDVAVTRRRNGLHLAVQDRDLGYPHPPGRSRGDPGDLDRRGLGLRMVHAAATAWGALPTPVRRLLPLDLRVRAVGDSASLTAARTRRVLSDPCSVTCPQRATPAGDGPHSSICALAVAWRSLPAAAGR
jgi:hypothetical protein